MKLQYKTAGLMIIIGTTILLVLTAFYLRQNRQVVLQKELQNLNNITEIIALQLNSHLKANAAITNTLSSATIIRDALLKSNAEFEVLSETERKNEIDTRNRQWKEAREINDPFIQKHLTNPVAEFLKLQQIIQPGLYGEIFLTNQYGAMIASTGKLTTLAHAHKNWWKAGYHNGEGRVFFDDRGLDASVKGYVLGVVVPVKNGDEIVGILKSNINIMGPLTDIIRDFGLRHPGKIQIVRTKGLIVAEKGKIPLSNRLHNDLIPYLLTKKMGGKLVERKGKSELVAFSPVGITVGSEKFGFGGSHESIDHIKGNKGEAWHIVATLDEETAMIDVANTTRPLIIAGLIFIVITSVIAWILGKWITSPLVKLANITQKIGEGQLDTRINITTKDEIGTLAKAFNKMMEYLQNTLISRDNLAQEIELRKNAEEKIQTSLKEKETLLQEIHHRVKNNMQVISGLLSLQMKTTDEKSTLKALQDSQLRIQAMSHIHEILYGSVNLSLINMKTYLQRLIGNLSQFLAIDPSKVKINVKVDEIYLSIEQANPLGLIVNELVSNSLKYAFPTDREGDVTVNLLTEGLDDIKLVVGDNGIGIPKSLNWQATNSLGLSLVQLLAGRQLDGEIELKQGSGTHFVIRFKQENQHAAV